MHIPILSPLVNTILRIVSFVIYALTLISAYGGYIDPGIISLPSILTLALPYFSLLTLLLTIYWFITTHYFTGLIGVATIIIGWGPITTASPLHFSKKAEYPDRIFTLISYNIIHSWDQRKPDYPGNRGFEYIMNSGADIICLQELTEWRPHEIPYYDTFKAKLDSIYPYMAGTWQSDTKILSKYPARLADTARLPLTNPEQKYYSIYQVDMPQHQMWVISVHMPSFALSSADRNVLTEMTSVRGLKESMRELKGSVRNKLVSGFTERAEIARELRKVLDYLDGPVILCGDLNDVPESFAYRTLMAKDMNDAWKETNFGPTFTYNMHLFYFHLDQIMYRGALRALRVDRGSINSSDHYPLEAKFEFTTPQSKATVLSQPRREPSPRPVETD